MDETENQRFADDEILGALETEEHFGPYAHALHQFDEVTERLYDMIAAEMTGIPESEDEPALVQLNDLGTDCALAFKEVIELALDGDDDTDARNDLLKTLIFADEQRRTESIGGCFQSVIIEGMSEEDVEEFVFNVIANADDDEDIVRSVTMRYATAMQETLEFVFQAFPIRESVIARMKRERLKARVSAVALEVAKTAIATTVAVVVSRRLSR
jgi:hypothetical protein